MIALVWFDSMRSGMTAVMVGRGVFIYYAGDFGFMV